MAIDKTRRTYTDPHYCQHPDCEAFAPPHKFGQIRAVEEGWFFGRDNETVFCPNHLPSWVGPWRKRRAEANAKRDADAALPRIKAPQLHPRRCESDEQVENEPLLTYDGTTYRVLKWSSYGRTSWREFMALYGGRVWHLGNPAAVDG